MTNSSDGIPENEKIEEIDQLDPLIENSNPVPDNDLEADVNESYKKIFENLQGNILKGHGRDFSANIFVTFSKSGKDLKEDIRKLSEDKGYVEVTSALKQVEETKQFNNFKIPGSRFGNIYLTARAYRKLGFSDDQLDKLFNDPPEGDKLFFPQHSNFVAGMKKAAEDLGDLPKDLSKINIEKFDVDSLTPLQKFNLKPEEEKKLDPLELAYAKDSIDALLLLADDDKGFILRETRKLVTRLKTEGIAKVVAIEMGVALRNDEDEGIEHFGYVDGRSQPLFLRSDFSNVDVNGNWNESINEKAKRKEDGNTSIWDPFAPLKLVLKKDEAVPDLMAYGSYFVFRKLEQDVLRFSMAEQQLADKLKLEGADRERAGAMIVGRFRDGTPLTLSETNGYVPAKANNFRYDGLDKTLQNLDDKRDDNLGLKCPFQAHIRKTNPRQSIKSEKDKEDVSIKDLLQDTPEHIEKRQKNEDDDRMRRIVRRGITYGERAKHPKDRFQLLDDLPTGDVGLLFGCFQKSIVKQFAFMQRAWANNIGFRVEAIPSEKDENQLTPSTGIDTLIGQPFSITSEGEDNPANPPQNWRKEYGEIKQIERSNTQTKEEIATLKIDLSLSHKVKYSISNFVKFRGGEFFFAPSLPFLEGKYNLESEKDNTAS